MLPIAALPSPSGSDGAGSAKPLSKKAKAAIVVRLLLNEGADIPLEDLPEELQEQLTHQMGNMRLVDRDTLAEVVAEFASELESIGLSVKDCPRIFERRFDQGEHVEWVGCVFRVEYVHGFDHEHPSLGS